MRKRGPMAGFEMARHGRHAVRDTYGAAVKAQRGMAFSQKIDQSPQAHQGRTEGQRMRILAGSTPATPVGCDAFHGQFQEIAASLLLLCKQPSSVQTNRQIQSLIRFSVRMTAMRVHRDAHDACRLPPSLGDLAVLSARAARTWRRRRDDPSDHGHR